MFITTILEALRAFCISFLFVDLFFIFCILFGNFFLAVILQLCIFFLVIKLFLRQTEYFAIKLQRS